MRNVALGRAGVDIDLMIVGKNLFENGGMAQLDRSEALTMAPKRKLPWDV